jgi:VanZ family protein
VLWLGIGALLVLTVIYLSVAPDVPAVPGKMGDKVGHVIAYAVLMFWFMQIYVARGPRLLAGILLVALGIALEFAQAHTGYRHFERADMIADALGVAVGWLLGPPRMWNVITWLEAAV